MCNRTDCAGSWAGPMACAVCREREMGKMKLTDAELVRLEELAGKASNGPFISDGSNQVFRGDGAPFAFAYAVGFPADDIQPVNCEYIAAACNAVPSLVAEVRRLRAELEQTQHGMEAAYMSGRADGRQEAEAENAALRDRVEALEELVAAHDNYLTVADDIVEQGKTPENSARLQSAYDRRAAAREAVR